MKSFFLKLAAFLAVVVMVQIVIVRYVAPLPEIEKLDRYLEEGATIIYFGDSSVLSVAPGDSDRASLSEMLERENPGIVVANLGHPGYHLGIYEAEVDYISRSKHKPDAVVIPIQLRAFSPEWDIRPVNQFEKERFFLMDRTSFISYFYRPLAILRAIDTNTVSYPEFLNTPVYYGTEQVGVVNDFEAVNKHKTPTTENIRNDYIYKYMFRLEETHRKFRSLDNLLDSASKASIKVYAYISPIDYENGTKHIGEDFTKQAVVNADLVCTFLESRGAPCLNLAFALGSEEFDHPGYPNEHLKERGRRLVTEKIDEFFLAR